MYIYWYISVNIGTCFKNYEFGLGFWGLKNGESGQFVLNECLNLNFLLLCNIYCYLKVSISTIMNTFPVYYNWQDENAINVIIYFKNPNFRIFAGIYSHIYFLIKMFLHLYYIIFNIIFFIIGRNFFYNISLNR